MAIRLRKINGQVIALCAARSIAKPGDVYIDDGQHYALARKFALDYKLEDDNEHKILIEQEESNNPNREIWDKMYSQE